MVILNNCKTLILQGTMVMEPLNHPLIEVVKVVHPPIPMVHCSFVQLTITGFTIKPAVKYKFY